MYLALAVSSAGFPPAIHVLGYSRMTIKEIKYFRLRDYHPLWCRFPATSSNTLFFDSSSNLHCHLTTPFDSVLSTSLRASPLYLNKEVYSEWDTQYRIEEFGLLRFRSPLLTKCIFVSIPPGTEMFHFPGFALKTYVLSYEVLLHRVSPFGHLRITG